MDDLIRYYYDIFIVRINPLLLKIKWSSTPYRVWKFGNCNKDKIFYFITDLSSEGSGIFSMYLDLLSHISIAQSMGWIPIIDNTSGLFRRTKVEYRKNKNVMNDFFAFNNQYSVDEVMHSRWVVISSLCDMNLFQKSIKKTIVCTKLFSMRKEELEYWKKISLMLPLHKELELKVDYVKEEMFGKKTDILGVAVREGKMGMDKKGIEASGETKQPTIEFILSETKKYIKQWNCKYVYLSCESEYTIQRFKEEITGNNVIVLDRTRLQYDYLVSARSMKDGVKKSRSNAVLQEKYDIIDREYIQDMSLLANCDYLIMPVNCGTEYAFLMNNKLRDFKII